MQTFDKILQLIYQISPLQKKRIENFLSKKDKEFFREAEKFASLYIGYLEHENTSLEYAVDAYLKMCSSMMTSQIQFIKTGKYPAILSDRPIENIYTNESEMKSYMTGLAISQFLWPTHYEMFCFFCDHIKNVKDRIDSYLEIGPGHGLFLNAAIDRMDNKSGIEVVDISPVSINITRSIINYFKPGNNNITYHNIDILKFDSHKRYSFITMGEVLEHVEYPDKLLWKLRNLLKQSGQAYLSTCVNGPAIDHIYHFKTIDEIKKLICQSGFIIAKELVLPTEDLPMNEIVAKKITINYCAIVERN